MECPKSNLPLVKRLLITVGLVFLHSSAHGTLITLSFRSVITQVNTGSDYPSGLFHFAIGDRVTGTFTIDTTTGQQQQDGFIRYEITTANFFDGNEPIGQIFSDEFGVVLNGFGEFSVLNDRENGVFGYSLNVEQESGYDFGAAFNLFTKSPSGRPPPISAFQHNSAFFGYTTGIPGEFQNGRGRLLTLTGPINQLVPDTGATVLLFAVGLTGIVLLHRKLHRNRLGSTHS